MTLSPVIRDFFGRVIPTSHDQIIAPSSPAVTVTVTCGSEMIAVLEMSMMSHSSAMVAPRSTAGVDRRDDGLGRCEDVHSDLPGFLEERVEHWAGFRLLAPGFPAVANALP
nr:hypothetical protein [Rhodococcus aetherivorans]